MLIRSALLIGACAMAIAGCETTEGYRQHMNLWYGQHSDRLIIEWGEPDRYSDLSDGRQVWIYHNVEIHEGGGYYDHQQYEREHVYYDDEGKVQHRTVTETVPVWVPPYTTRTECNTHFVVSEQNIIREVTFKGDGCVARELR